MTGKNLEAAEPPVSQSANRLWANDVKPLYVRAVNGEGPICEKCGNHSALHVGEGYPDNPYISFYLCARCTYLAVEGFVMGRYVEPAKDAK